MPALGLLVFVAGLCLVPVVETDLFFRLAAGEHFLRTGALVRKNLFSFTYPDHPYPDPAWLFDLGAAALHRLSGFPAVVLAKTVVLLATFGLAYRLCRRRGGGPAAAAVALAAAAWVMSERMVERPHLFSFLGVVLVQRALLGSPRGLWAVPAIVAAWANLHAGAFLGPALLALAALGALAESRATAGSTRADALRFGAHAGGAALAATAALMLTPVGTGIFHYLAFHRGLFHLHPVDEFRPPSWTSDAPLLAFLGLVVVLAVLGRPARERWRHVFPVAGLALLAATSIRFGAELALVAAPLAAERLTALGQRLRRVKAALDAAGAPLRILVALTLAGAALFPRAGAAMSGRPFVSLRLDETALPLDALAFVDAHGLRGRMYNDFELGGYLTWRDWPRHRVFVDPRLPAYPREFHALLGRADLPRAAWDAALERHGVDVALLGYAGINARVAFFDPARWALIYRERDARVFVRRNERFARLIAEREIPATFRFSMATGAETVPLPAPPAGSSIPGCEWQRRLGDLLFELDEGASARALQAYRRALGEAGCLSPVHEASTAAFVGSVAVRARRFGEALPLIERALAHTPDDLSLLASRALSLEETGRTDEARSAWHAVAARAGDSDLGQRARERARSP